MLDILTCESTTTTTVCRNCCGFLMRTRPSQPIYSPCQRCSVYTALLSPSRQWTDIVDDRQQRLGSKLVGKGCGSCGDLCRSCWHSHVECGACRRCGCHHYVVCGCVSARLQASLLATNVLYIVNGLLVLRAVDRVDMLSRCRRWAGSRGGGDTEISTTVPRMDTCHHRYKSQSQFTECMCVILSESVNSCGANTSTVRTSNSFYLVQR